MSLFIYESQSKYFEKSECGTKSECVCARNRFILYHQSTASSWKSTIYYFHLHRKALSKHIYRAVMVLFVWLYIYFFYLCMTVCFASIVRFNHIYKQAQTKSQKKSATWKFGYVGTLKWDWLFASLHIMSYWSHVDERTDLLNSFQRYLRHFAAILMYVFIEPNNFN